MNTIESTIRDIKQYVHRVFPDEDNICVGFTDWTYVSGVETITYSIWTGRTKFSKEFNNIDDVYAWLEDEERTDAQKILFRKF